MDEKILEQFVKELQRIVQHKPLSEEFKSMPLPSQSLENLRDGFEYLSTSLLEAYEFSSAICQGELQTPLPDRYNFFTGPLKELHSVLKHLTWQTIQVSHGDYSQHIDYLGDFSTYFNAMIDQLQERETLLKKQAESLHQTLSLFKLITNAQDNWILVLDMETQEFVYANDYAKAFFFNPETKRTSCHSTCPLVTKLKSFIGYEENFMFEYQCSTSNSHILVKGFPSYWNNKETIVFYLKDITVQKQKDALLRDIAYRDPLTKIYNRRYFIEYMEKYSLKKENYSIVNIDVDGLKYVNDSFGHIFGDDYLCTIVSVIQENIRSTDLFCRFGGDEFLLLLPNCTEEIAHTKMEYINDTLKNMKKHYPLSLSYGILYVLRDNTMPLNEILSIIDQKMYLYKKKNKQPRPKLSETKPLLPNREP